MHLSANFEVLEFSILSCWRYVSA